MHSTLTSTQRRNVLRYAGATAAATVLGTAHAQSYPGSKPITIVVGYPPGGSTDFTARTVAAELAKKLGTTVIVDNVSGAEIGRAHV